MPRDHWLEPWERKAIIDYFDRHPLEGYRRLSFMMLDEGVVAVSPSDDVPGFIQGWASGPVEPEGVEEGERLCSASKPV